MFGNYISWLSDGILSAWSGYGGVLIAKPLIGMHVLAGLSKLSWFQEFRLR